MEYLYLDIDKNCKTCNGNGMGKWSGNDCPKCLKKIDISNMVKFQLEELKEMVEKQIKKQEK